MTEATAYAVAQSSSWSRAGRTHRISSRSSTLDGVDADVAAFGIVADDCSSSFISSSDWDAFCERAEGS